MTRFRVETWLLLPKRRGKPLLPKSLRHLPLNPMHPTAQSVCTETRRARLAVLIQVCAVALTPLLTRAEGFVSVCSPEDLQEALKGGGLIGFGCSGTIALPEAIVVTQDAILDAGTNRVVLTTQLTNRLFFIQSGVHLTLQGMVLRGGRVIGANGADGGPGEDGGSGQTAYGAAVYNDQGYLTAIDTRFESNFAQGGDGGRGADGDAVQSRGRQGGRGGEARGGAIYNAGDGVLVRCVFADNAAFGGAGGAGGNAFTNLSNALGGDGNDGAWARGGAVYSALGSTLQIQDCSFARNTAAGEIAGGGGVGVSGRSFPAQSGAAGVGTGGAIYTDSTLLSLTGSTFNDNFAAGADGWDGLNGLEARSGQDGFSGAGASGGALSVVGGQAALTNCTFFANGVLGGDGGNGGAGGTTDLGAGGGDGGDGGTGLGGGIRTLAGAQVLLVNCTLSLNEAHGGAGGTGGAPGTSLQDRGERGSNGSGQGTALSNKDAEILLVNTLLDGATNGENVHGALSDGGHNLSSDASAGWTRPSSLVGLDPRVAWLADNGGLTLTAALKADSPAIDQGDDAAAPLTDQRGQERVGRSDIGAFEFEPSAATPTLNIQIEGDDWVISWPATLTGWRLRASQDPASGEWVEVEGFQLTGKWFVCSGKVSTSEASYFRLMR